MHGDHESDRLWTRRSGHQNDRCLFGAGVDGDGGYTVRCCRGACGTQEWREFHLSIRVQQHIHRGATAADGSDFSPVAPVDTAGQHHAITAENAEIIHFATARN